MRRTLAAVLLLFMPGCMVVNGPVAVAPPVVEPFASPGGDVIDEAEWCRRVERPRRLRIAGAVGAAGYSLPEPISCAFCRHCTLED